MKPAEHPAADHAVRVMKVGTRCPIIPYAAAGCMAAHVDDRTSVAEGDRALRPRGGRPIAP